MITIEITDSNEMIKYKILKVLADNINECLKNTRSKIEEKIKGLVGISIQKSKTYTELIDGPLAGELGIPLGKSNIYVRPIVDAVLKSCFVRYKKLFLSSGNNFIGGYTILLLESSYRDVLKLDDINPIISEKANVKIDWIHWLLLEGNKIISDYEIKFGPFGRSGQAMMKLKEGQTWRMPREHVGYPNDNWLTRVLYSKDMRSGIEDIIEKEISDAIL